MEIRDEKKVLTDEDKEVPDHMHMATLTEIPQAVIISKSSYYQQQDIQLHSKAPCWNS